MADTGVDQNRTGSDTFPSDGMGAGLLVSELAEVYLLLDNVSAVASKPVPDLSDDPLFVNAEKKSWIEQICEIRWPPKPGQPQDEALNAARLMRAKDKLNSAAQPASGASIAFTKMISGDSIDTVPSRRPWWQLWGDTAGEKGPGIGSTGPTFDRLGGSAGSPRKCLASYAFPELYRRAGRYRGIYTSLHVCLVVVLILTCFMSWRLAAGSSLLNDVTHSTVVETAPPPLSGNAVDAVTVAGAGNAVDAVNAAGAGNTVDAVVGNGSAAADDSAPAVIEPGTAARKQDRAIATRNLMRWVDENSWMEALVGGGNQQRYYPAGNTPGSEVPNVAWAAVLIGVLTGTILPILYGMLGASAAVVRSLANKMSASTLMPRDLILGLIQFALGAVIGACVGLFVNGSGNSAATGSGLLGPVSLSTSALCFLAGFGVEGVFRALESLVNRVFPVATPAIAAPLPPPVLVTVQTTPTPPGTPPQSPAPSSQTPAAPSQPEDDGNPPPGE